MIRTAITSLVVVGVLALATAGTAHAAPAVSTPHAAKALGWGVGVGVSFPVHYHRPVVYRPVVQYQQIPIFQTVFVGYDGWGHPIYQQVVVGYQTVPIQTGPAYPVGYGWNPSVSVGFGYRHR